MTRAYQRRTLIWGSNSSPYKYIFIYFKKPGNTSFVTHASGRILTFVMNIFFIEFSSNLRAPIMISSQNIGLRDKSQNSVMGCSPPICYVNVPNVFYTERH